MRTLSCDFLSVFSWSERIFDQWRVGGKVTWRCRVYFSLLNIDFLLITRLFAANVPVQASGNPVRAESVSFQHFLLPPSPLISNFQPREIFILFSSFSANSNKTSHLKMETCNISGTSTMSKRYASTLIYLIRARKKKETYIMCLRKSNIVNVEKHKVKRCLRILRSLQKQSIKSNFPNDLHYLLRWPSTVKLWYKSAADKKKEKKLQL